MTAALTAPVKSAPAPRVCPTCLQPYVGRWSECGPCITAFIAVDTAHRRLDI